MKTARKAPVFDGTPHTCPSCRKRPGFYYGKFVFAGEEVPTCPNRHPGGATLTLVPTLASPRGSSSAGRS